MAGTKGLAGLRPVAWGLAAVGLGSMAFHGTMTRWGQAADELAILWWEVSLLLAVLDGRWRPWLLALLALENVGYWAMDSWPALWMLYHPAHGLIDAAAVVAVGRETLASGLDGNARLALLLGVVSIVVAVGAWTLDMWRCTEVQHLKLHAWGWHLFSAFAIGCLHLSLAFVLGRRAKLDRVVVPGLGAIPVS